MNDIFYKKVLVLSSTEISSNCATGSLLRELFSILPKKQIGQITSSRSDVRAACEYERRIVLRSFWSRLLMDKKLSITSPLFINQNKAYEFTRSFKPDLIYLRYSTNSLYLHTLGNRISENFGIPMVVHIMDDIERGFSGTFFLLRREFLRQIVSRQIRKSLALSKANFSISKRMSKDFEKRYGFKFFPVHNGVDPKEWSLPSPIKNPFIGSSKKMVLVGALAHNKERETAIKLCCCIDHFNHSHSEQVELLLNVQQDFLPLAQVLSTRYLGVKAEGYKEITEYREMLKSADCLVICRNFDDSTRAYTQLSFHNKLPEYMASGTPILCIAPSYDSSAELIQKYDLGIVVNDLNEDAISNALETIVSNPEGCQEKALNARKYCFNNFDINNIRNFFYKKLCEAML